MNLLEIAQRIGVEGFLHCNELHKLVELAAGRDVLEVGSYRGLSAWGIAMSARSLTCVDTFRACSNGQRQEVTVQTLDAFIAAVDRYSNVTWMEATSEDAAVRLADATFDMIFVDAMHTYQEVAADIRRWWQRVLPGGVFVMHDYGHGDFPGVKRAADEVFGPATEESVEVTLRWVPKP